MRCGPHGNDRHLREGRVGAGRGRAVMESDQILRVAAEKGTGPEYVFLNIQPPIVYNYMKLVWFKTSQ